MLRVTGQKSCQVTREDPGHRVISDYSLSPGPRHTLDTPVFTITLWSSGECEVREPGIIFALKCFLLLVSSFSGNYHEL